MVVTKSFIEIRKFSTTRFLIINGYSILRANGNQTYDQWDFYLQIMIYLVFGLVYPCLQKPWYSELVYFWVTLFYKINIFFFVAIRFSSPGLDLEKDYNGDPWVYPCEKCGYFHKRDLKYCQICKLCFKGYKRHCVFAYNCITQNNALFFPSAMVFGFISSIPYQYCLMNILQISNFSFDLHGSLWTLLVEWNFVGWTSFQMLYMVMAAVFLVFQVTAVGLKKLYHRCGVYDNID